MRDCVFCASGLDRVILEDDLAYVLWDAFPVTPLHTLVIPRRHAVDYFALTREEVLACHELLGAAKDQLLAQDSAIEGFNIGLNVGAAAGQTVFHCHFHLIPRRRGDVELPRGGVRHLIPGKGTY